MLISAVWIWILSNTSVNVGVAVASAAACIGFLAVASVASQLFNIVDEKSVLRTSFSTRRDSYAASTSTTPRQILGTAGLSSSRAS